MEVPGYRTKYIPYFYSFLVKITCSTFVINQPCIELQQQSATLFQDRVVKFVVKACFRPRLGTFDSDAADYVSAELK